MDSIAAQTLLSCRSLSISDQPKFYENGSSFAKKALVCGLLQEEPTTSRLR
ncbi:hypothetical protein FH972_026620 [Carpinus fangiana]|uniref:Uncharacterized protein n=1 Tax=Carpinus fangiana TaxID=176857 RepID=A0A5N6L715_9ROSI|nr:hypothetical protein FH972_026620 [Carpinus fangiana]